MTTSVITGVNVNNITPPRVPFLEERTGLISRQWYLWFLNMFARVNQGDDVAQLVAALAVAPDASAAYSLAQEAAYQGSLLAPTQDVSVVVQQVAQDYLGPAAMTPQTLSLGGMITLLVSTATATQQLTNADTTIAFDTDIAGAFGYAGRTGNVFTVTAHGAYVVLLKPQVQQDQNNNITKFWVNINGTAVVGSGVIHETAAAGDNNAVFVPFAKVLSVGDQITFHAITSIANGSSLLFTAAAAPAPSVTATQVVITGYKT